MTGKKDELTKKMHSEFTVSESEDQQHATWMALEEIADGTMTKNEAIQQYGLNESDLNLHLKSWKDLKNG